MRQLLYVSNARREFDQVQLDSILADARRNNAAHDVTGMLLYLDGAFLQVLEGPAEEVGEIYNKIMQDTRHWGVQVLLDRQGYRAFPAWSMGFERLKGGDSVFPLDEEALSEHIPLNASLDVTTLVKTFYAIHKAKP